MPSTIAVWQQTFTLHNTVILYSYVNLFKHIPEISIILLLQNMGFPEKRQVMNTVLVKSYFPIA